MWISTRDEWAGTLRRDESDIARTDTLQHFVDDRP
jgi:hypothetical protein